MARARAHESDEDEPRHRGRDSSDDEDQPEYDYEQRPRRGKSDRKSRAREPSDDEEPEEDEEDSDEESHRHKKQLVVRKKSKKGKSSDKEIAREKRHDSDDSSFESSEEETKREKKKGKRKKSKSKSHDDEDTLKISKWEYVHRDEVDADFLDTFTETLGVHPGKFYNWVEQDLLRRHTQTGEYNVDLMFERGVLAREDKKAWEGFVRKAQNNPQRKRILYSTMKTGELVYTEAIGPSMRHMERRGDYDDFGMDSGPGLMGHADYNRRCHDCRHFGGACGFF
ncbi:MAG: hypothetical protein Q9226_001124 [Calogaya cf. arnoldii]